MRLFKRRIRGFFALQALLLLAAIVISLSNPTYVSRGISPLRHYTFLAAYCLLCVIFATAWWSTRKPGPFRNLWAIAASLVSIAAGGYILWLDHSIVTFSAYGLIAIAVGLGGLFIYGQGGSPNSQTETSPTTVVQVRKPVSVAGDRTSPWVNRAFTVLSVAAQFAAIFLWSLWARSHGLTHSGRLPWFILFTVAVLSSTVLHECGHAIVAWGFHMKLLSFNAGPFQWRKLEGKWKFKFDLTGFDNLGGAVRTIPTNPKQPRAHDLWMIAAGPLANIFTGLLFLWAVLHSGLPFYQHTWRLVAYTASFSFIAAITNMLPFMTEDGGYSDGAQILQILTKSPIYDYRRTMNSLASTLVTERRYRDLDIDAIERAANQFPQEFRGMNLQLCASNFYLDCGRIREARLALAAAEAIQSNFAIDLSASLHTPFVIGHAYLNHDATAARRWWDRMEAKNPKRQNVDYWLAQTALLWIEGHPKEADEAWQKADAEAQKLPHFGSCEFDRSRCALLRHELDNPSSGPVARLEVEKAAAAPAFAPARAVRDLVDPLRFDPLAFIRTAATMEKLRG
jgi:Zn-dependent protease